MCIRMPDLTICCIFKKMRFLYSCKRFDTSSNSLHQLVKKLPLGQTAPYLLLGFLTPSPDLTLPCMVQDPARARHNPRAAVGEPRPQHVPESCRWLHWSRRDRGTV